MKHRYPILLATLATTLAFAPAFAQTAAPQYQSQPAPIERGNPGNANPQFTPQYGPRNNNITSNSPAAGVFVTSNSAASLATLSATLQKTELRLDRGIANVNIHHPAHNSFIQVDLPGGQVNLLKDGLYTFNAETNTVRVLHGEAETQIAGQPKPIKIKEDHSVTFNGPGARSVEFYPIQARADLLINPAAGDRSFYGPYEYPNYGYPYPYYAYGYPYGPWGFYPSFGFGFGYRGGFRGRFR